MRKPMSDILILLAIFVGWILLQTIILPKMGVNT
jgi:hypothetical protein